MPDFPLFSCIFRLPTSFFDIFFPSPPGAPDTTTHRGEQRARPFHPRISSPFSNSVGRQENIHIDRLEMRRGLVRKNRQDVAPAAHMSWRFPAARKRVLVIDVSALRGGATASTATLCNTRTRVSAAPGPHISAVPDLDVGQGRESDGLRLQCSRHTFHPHHGQLDDCQSG